MSGVCSMSVGRIRLLALVLTLCFAVAQVASQQRRPRNQVEPVSAGPHLGTIDQALVGVEVTNIAKDESVRETRRGIGLILRCDGFVLAPRRLFSTAITVAGHTEEVGRQGVSIVVNPGT